MSFAPAGSHQLMGAQGLLDKTNFYISGEDAQMVCPEMWKHRVGIYLPQPRHRLAIVPRQDNATGFGLTRWCIQEQVQSLKTDSMGGGKGIYPWQF